MLAAIPDNPRHLELVKLILTMVANNGQEIPAHLKEFIVTVISDAKAVSDNPSSVSKIKYSEAIQLALEMKQASNLADSISQVTNFESIHPEIANRMLMTMGRRSA